MLDCKQKLNYIELSVFITSSPVKFTSSKNCELRCSRRALIT